VHGVGQHGHHDDGYHGPVGVCCLAQSRSTSPNTPHGRCRRATRTAPRSTQAT
jgi:hypothetical protein